jgi:hypothetical protein
MVIPKPFRVTDAIESHPLADAESLEGETATYKGWQSQTMEYPADAEVVI